MSLWFEHLQIGFCADRLVCVRFSRGFRPAVIDKQEIAVTGEGETPWGAALEKLKSHVAALKGRQTLHSVVLTERFVRHALVPWQPNLLRKAEREAYARHVFRETFGQSATHWAVTVSDGGYGRPALASAVDQKLIDGLRGIYQGHRLRSIQPYLTAAYGQFRKNLNSRGTGPDYFGVVEDEDLSVIRLAGGQLNSVYHQRVHGDWQKTLQGLLLQAAGLGEESRTINVLAPGRGETGFVGTTRINRLALPVRRGYSPLSDPGIAMGVVGV